MNGTGNIEIIAPIQPKNDRNFPVTYARYIDNNGQRLDVILMSLSDYNTTKQRVSELEAEVEGMDNTINEILKKVDVAPQMVLDEASLDISILN